MNSQKPIYTEKTRCQDCYKCVRECPVKAIQVVEDSAAVMPERCVYCGNCVNVCPVGAKKVRDDLVRAKLLLKRKPRVIASLAPSFVSEFPGVEPGRLIHALLALGFWAVSETALGAEEISRACAQLMKNGAPGTYISTACPTVVELIKHYHPEQTACLTRLVSPLLAHCKLLKREYGDDIGVVFIGPCISKKLEADAHPELLNAVLTFTDLRKWLDERGINPALEPCSEKDIFLPGSARDGALYPADGGMSKGISARQHQSDTKFMAFSGIRNLQEAMQGLFGQGLNQKLFLEFLACKGGCVNGPQVCKGHGTALKWLQVMDYASEYTDDTCVPSAMHDLCVPAEGGGCLPEPPLSRLDLYSEMGASPVSESTHDLSEVGQALRRLGKTQPEDELNCGGCGYDSCLGLAMALLNGWAEPNMCVSYMRKLAMNKANALIRSMPAGVVIVNENLMVVECNRRFAETLGGDAPMIFDAKPGMEGADFSKLAPEMRNYFLRGLETEIDALRKDVRVDNRVLRLTVFTVEPKRIVGGVLQDITEPAVQREQIMQKAQEVIRKNVKTVQQIAYLLGENVAETEMMLESLSSSFPAPPSPLGGRGPDEDPNHVQ